MFAGHVGAGLVIGRIERRVNVGIFIAAALLLDFILWFLVLFGWESVSIPADFATTHQAHFVFPYSHGLVASLAWSVLAAAVEAAIVVVGLLLYARGSSLTRAKPLALTSLTLVILVFTAVGMTLAPPPPSALAMAGSSVLTLVLICALAWWLGRVPRAC